MNVIYTDSATEHSQEISALLIDCLSAIDNIQSCTIDYIKPNGFPSEGIFYIMLPESTIGVIFTARDAEFSAIKIRDIVVSISLMNT